MTRTKALSRKLVDRYYGVMFGETRQRCGRIIRFGTRTITMIAILCTWCGLFDCGDSFLLSQVSLKSARCIERSRPARVIPFLGRATIQSENQGSSSINARYRRQETVPDKSRGKDSRSTPSQSRKRAISMKPTDSKTFPTQCNDLLNHEILTKQEELLLSNQLRTAIQVKSRMQELQDTKELERIQWIKDSHDLMERSDDDEDDFDSDLSLEDQLEDFLMRNRKDYTRQRSGHYIQGYGYEYDEVEDQELLGLSMFGIDQRNSLEHYEARSLLTKGKNSLDIADISLSDQEIIDDLKIPGGRTELTRILIDGARAREKLITCNIRLVVSISKKWFFKIGAGAVGNASRHGGSWTIPSMAEVIQEGILGLAKAVERFEPNRNLKLSTYATYYITNEVRKCLQGATTGCLRLPPNYYGIRIKYQSLVKKHYLRTGNPLRIEKAAETMGMKVRRLQFILKMTDPLVQLDGPIPTGIANGAGKAGSNLQTGGALLTFVDTLEWYVLGSLFRQFRSELLTIASRPTQSAAWILPQRKLWNNRYCGNALRTLLP